MLSGRLVGTPNAQWAKEKWDGISGILLAVINARNLKFQIKLSDWRGTQDLFEKSAYKSEMEIAIKSEPYKNRYGGVWATDSNGGMAIWVCGWQAIQRTISQAPFWLCRGENKYIVFMYVYSCYAPLNMTMSELVEGGYNFREFQLEISCFS